MSKHEIMTGGMTHGSLSDNVVHRDPAASKELRGAIKALDAQIRSGEIDNKTYNVMYAALMPDTNTKSPTNVEALPSGESKITYAPGVAQYVEQAKLEAIDTAIVSVQDSVRAMHDSMDSGRTVNKHSIERLGKLLIDAKIGAERSGASVENQAFIDLTATVRQTQQLAYEYRRARR